MDEKLIRKEITERWIMAVDHLINIHKLNSYRELEALTGIQNQRINLIKAYVKNPEDARNSFAHIDYIWHLAKLFKVSLEYLYFGAGPIISETKEVKESDLPDKIEITNDLEYQKYGISSYIDMMKRLAGLEEENRILKTMVNNINEKLGINPLSF